MNMFTAETYFWKPLSRNASKTEVRCICYLLFDYQIDLKPHDKTTNISVDNTDLDLRQMGCTRALHRTRGMRRGNRPKNKEQIRTN